MNRFPTLAHASSLLSVSLRIVQVVTPKYEAACSMFRKAGRIFVSETAGSFSVMDVG
jgi:hypothetical protein